MRKTVKARDVEVGTAVYFPSSRRPQVVDTITSEGEGESEVLTLAHSTGRWKMNADFSVDVEVDEDAEG